MVCRCPSCGAALKYDPESQKMVCAFCKNTYMPEDVERNEYMECNVYTCTACGGELMANELETSTFCSYCGQPAIVFSRVSKEYKPDLILPFSVTKEEAITEIRNHLKRRFLIPKEIRNFEVERIRGIYIPFWISNVDYEEKTIIKANHGSSKSKKWHHHYRHGNCHFKHFTADASKRLSDESSQRLEPYDIDSAVPFQTSYLSGFYADRYDVLDTEVEEIIEKRAKDFYEEKILTTVSGSDKSFIERKTDIVIKNPTYAMLPVWFMTFLYQDQPYTFLVNGQTKKIIGSVPYRKNMVRALWATISAAFIYPSYLLTLFLWDPASKGKSLLCLIGAMVFAWAVGVNQFDAVEKSMKLTTSKVLNQLVKERERE